MTKYRCVGEDREENFRLQAINVNLKTMISGSVIEKRSCFVFLVSAAFCIKRIDFYDIILIQTLKKGTETVCVYWARLSFFLCE